MTKSALAIFFSFLMVIPSLAQESIGFSDSTDFQYIIDYRLPDWGYSNFYISTGRFRTNGRLDQSTESRIFFGDPEVVADIENNSIRNSANLHFSPAFEYYRESEQRIIHFTNSLSAGTGFNKRKDETLVDSESESVNIQNQNSEHGSRSAGISYNLEFNSKYYLTNNLFLITDFDGYVSFSKKHSYAEYENNPPNDNESDEVSRYLNLKPEIGIGFGRVRNIAPQIRAIRLKERYQQISDGTLNNNEIISGAEQFTRLQGYSRTRDRYQKYFWGDMNQVLSGKLDQINAYDILYLTDVLNENLGQRLEGFDVSITGRYSYTNNLTRNEGMADDVTTFYRNLNINRWAGTYSQLRYYNNLSLNHQLGFRAGHQLSFPLERNNNIKMQTIISSNFSWLWTVTDRYLLTTSLGNYYRKPVFKERIQDIEQLTHETYLSSSLSYFIENKLAITGSISTNFDHMLNNQINREFERNRFRWSVNLNVRYYFERKIF